MIAMSPRKNKSNPFSSWKELRTLMLSTKTKFFNVFARVSSKYPGIVESLFLLSKHSGKQLVWIHDFESYGRRETAAAAETDETVAVRPLEATSNRFTKVHSPG